MKRRPTARKPTARKSAAKKTMKPSKPVQAARTPARSADAGKYTPTPIQGIGWAPFRYPL